MIKITPEMLQESKKQTDIREVDINHHFAHPNLTTEQANQIGFLGEFAACVFFEKDWKENIREDYKTIDSFDIMLRNARIDVKTESVGSTIFEKLKKFKENTRKPDGQQLIIEDDIPYGRRLINGGQRWGIKDKNVILFGAVDRDSIKKDGEYLTGLSGWLPLGYITTNNVLEYEIITQKPYQAKKPDYLTPVMAIRSSHLLTIEHLKSRYQRATLVTP